MVDFDYAQNLIQVRTEMAMTSTIQILRGALDVLDPVTLQVGGIQSAATIYTGYAHIHNVRGAGVISLGEGQIDTRTVQISYPIYAPMAHRDDLVKVTTDSDPDLPNRIFRVMDIDVGGLLGSYHLMSCQGWMESRYWN